MKPPKQFIINNNSVLEVYDVDDEWMIYDPHFIRKSDTKVYDNKDDAMYAKLIQELQNGKDLSNFKSSPYYKGYVQRLKKENPEYLI